MNTRKQDHVTVAIATYVKENGFQLKTIACGTGISLDALKISIEKGKRKLRIEEFLALCSYFNMDPRAFACPDNYYRNKAE